MKLVYEIKTKNKEQQIQNITKQSATLNNKHDVTKNEIKIISIKIIVTPYEIRNKGKLL